MTVRSPLYMVTQEPSVHRLVTYLQGTSRHLLRRGHSGYRLSFSRTHIEEARQAFGRTIRQGEARLHRLCGLLSRSFFGHEWDMSSVVVGKVKESAERFTLVRNITPEELYAHTDLDLGNRQLQRLRFETSSGWSQATLVANFVEYQPRGPNQLGVYKLTSRIKAEQEIWNKVVDEIFHIDHLVASDKQLRHLSRYVKDVFGFKILVSDEDSARALHNHLTTWEWTAAELWRYKAPFEPNTRRLEFLEVKDYLAPNRTKDSGWRAMKSVVRWWDQTFEIQVQPLRNYFRERERLTQESHAGFKARREELRDRIARAMPLFSFYRSLLRWLFLEPDGPPPNYAGVTIELRP